MALQKRISDAESDMSDTQAALASRCQELSNITADWTSKLNEVAARHNEELAAERQKSFEVRFVNIQFIARLWNSLPSHVTAAPSLSIFCCRLKSHLFSLSYPTF